VWDIFLINIVKRGNLVVSGYGRATNYDPWMQSI
jgi:hypothetical protein